MLKLGKEKIIVISTSATFVIQEMSAHTRTWNLKAALGPKPCKVNQQYRHTNVNQHVLAEEVPDNTDKNQIPSSFTKKSIVQSCPICSVAPIQTSIKMRWAKKFPDKRLSLKLYSAKVKHNLLPEETL